MADIKPYGPRVAVVDPPAEQQRPSGLIIPLEYDRCAKGIVVGVGDDVAHLTEGCLVFYPMDCGLDLGTVKIIEAKCVFAWEDRL